MVMYYNRKRLNDRAIDELVGLSKGIIADKVVNHSEAKFLKSWMEANVPCSNDMQVNQIYRRIHEMLIDGIFDENEQKELLELLQMFTGEINTVQAAKNMTATIPLDKPAPVISFAGKSFCFTGKFAYGPRSICKEVVIERNGIISKNIIIGLDYLVCGYLGSTDWIHSPYGRKIEKAMEYRENLGNPCIITEDNWAQAAFEK